jgi:hypothetical protein
MRLQVRQVVQSLSTPPLTLCCSMRVASAHREPIFFRVLTDAGLNPFTLKCAFKSTGSTPGVHRPRDAIGAESINPVSSVPERREYRTRALLGEKKLGAWGGFRLSAPNTCWTTGSSVTPGVDGMRCTSGFDVVRFVAVFADPSERVVEAAARFPGRRGQLLRRWLAHGLAKLVVLPVRTPPPMHRRVVFPYGKRAQTACNGCAWYTRL